ncbi:aspartic proteinase nepenthesin-1-like [Papaver somniferum]|uniref:aspartic proteinase nepenthesin-1-like n=1 Tax=Papaver somniferum TaxID=3469 RepID=UPI000E7040E0|nr:aspartic proteinase nepenthesin-1-like [Papaver somniferum]
MSRKYDASSIVFVITVVCISFLLNLSIAAKPRGFSMKMIRSDSKESPLHQRYANLTQAERFRGLVEQSKARVRHLGSARAAAYNKSISMNPDIVRPTVAMVRETGFYIGEVGIGTFNGQAQTFRNFYLIIDTSSDIIWTQCRVGNHYFYQDAEFYDQQGSTSYHPMTCDEKPEYCVGDLCDEDNFCLYRQGYMSGAQSSGELARETFTINSNEVAHTLESHEGIIMGCGLDQTGFGQVLDVPEREGGEPWDGPIPYNAPIAGYLGLGRGTTDFSLVLQLDNKFEYCLESYDLPGADASHTYLRFGADTIIGGGPEVRRTPFIEDANFRTPYHLTLLDISLDAVSAEFNKHAFEIRKDGTGGTIIDSAAPFTTMVMPHYERVRQLFVDYFHQLGIDPIAAAPHALLDTCWVIPADFNDYPTMTFHFQDADFVILKESGIFSYFEDHNLLCLGIVGLEEDDASYHVVLGAMQQSNKRIMYDLADEALFFKEEECNFGA